MIDCLLMSNPSLPEIPTVPGTPYEGGYYVGRMNIDGYIYAIVISPKAQGAIGNSVWQTGSFDTPGTSSTYDGAANTQALLSKPIGTHPLADLCRGLVINGKSDWYIPSIDEFELCYRYLKPSEDVNSEAVGPHGPVGVNPYSVPAGKAYTVSDPAMTTDPLFMTTGSETISTPGTFWSSTQGATASLAWKIATSVGWQGENAKTSRSPTRLIRRVLIGPA